MKPKNKKMNRTVFPIIFGILLIGLASAIYPGESIEYKASDLGLNNITNVSISENLSEILYNFTTESAIFKIPEDAMTQNFIISFSGYKEDGALVVIHTNSGGGGGWNRVVVGGNAENSYICSEKWQCGDWGNCTNGEQTRICTDTAQCGTSINKPAITQECKKENQTSKNFLTVTGGAILDFAKSGAGITVILVLTTTVLGGITFFSFRKRKFKK